MKTLIQNTALAIAFSAVAASAQSLETWGTAGGWDVMIDPSLGYGCLIQAEYTDGSLVRIGLDRNEDMGYVTAFNMAWGDIEEGAIYDIAFALDDEVYQGEARGIWLNGVPGADIYFDSVDFLFDIAKKYTMTLFNSEGEVMAIDLEGSYIGLAAVMMCQDEMG